MSLIEEALRRREQDGSPKAAPRPPQPPVSTPPPPQRPPRRAPAAPEAPDPTRDLRRRSRAEWLLAVGTLVVLAMAALAVMLFWLAGRPARLMSAAPAAAPAAPQPGPAAPTSEPVRPVLPPPRTPAEVFAPPPPAVDSATAALATNGVPPSAATQAVTQAAAPTLAATNAPLFAADGWPLFGLKGIAVGANSLAVLDTGEMLVTGELSRTGARVVRIEPEGVTFGWHEQTKRLRKGERSDKPLQ